VTAVTRQARRAAAEEFAAAWHELHAVYEQEKAAAKREGRHVQETPAYWAANNRVAPLVADVTTRAEERDPFGYEAEAREQREAQAERMRVDYPHRRQVLAAAAEAGRGPDAMTEEAFAAWQAEEDDLAADTYGDRQVQHYVDRMTELDLAGELDPPATHDTDELE